MTQRAFYLIRGFIPLRNAENIKQGRTDLGHFEANRTTVFSNFTSTFQILEDRSVWLIHLRQHFYRSGSNRVQSLHKSDTVSTWLIKPPTYFHYTVYLNIYGIPYVLAPVQVSLGFPVALNYTSAPLCRPLLLFFCALFLFVFKFVFFLC